MTMSSNTIQAKFWEGKRVLLTGHTGFKGSWLSLWLQSLGAELCGIALDAPTQPSLFDLAGVASGMQHHTADIRDAKVINKLIKNFRPEIVIHMAAQPLVRLSYQEPVDTFATNIMGTVNLLEAVRLAGGVRAVVNVTTDKCYENKEWVWGYREGEALGGHDPYSSSKACAELISHAYRASFLSVQGTALATARAGNVIGGGDWAADRLVPDVLRALQEQELVLVRNPHAVRPWQHVLEPLSAYLLLAQRLYEEGPSHSQSWNFGPREEDARPVKWIVETLCTQWGEDARWGIQEGDHPHEAGYLKLDSGKARQYLGWVPRWTLQTALTHVTDWHKAWLRGADMRAFTLQQISLHQGPL